MNLEFDAQASGHVNVWKNYAAAAVGRDDVDLTVYFLGPRRTEAVAPNVRFEIVPGAISTRRLRLRQGGGHADIGFHNRLLARRLERHDVLHTTDFFCFGATARRVARRHGKPLVYSIHSLQPEYSRIYWPEIAEGLFGQILTRYLLIKSLRTHDLIFWFLTRGLKGLLWAADVVLVFHAGNLPAGAGLPPERIFPLRRGSDIAAFRPGLRDPDALKRRFGIPLDRHVVLFVGRLDQTKAARLIANAVAALVEKGKAVHGLFVGRGHDAGAIEKTLGTHATLPGVLPFEDLPAIYASADVLAVPAQYETWGNVVVEAKASGLPVLVARGTATERHVVDGIDGLVVADRQVATWAEAIEAVIGAPPKHDRMSAAARHWAESSALSWDAAMSQDLVPVWRRLAQSG